MAIDLSDFKCYLQYNCLKDYQTFTSADVKEPEKNTILSRHKKAFGIWYKLMNDWHLNNFFAMRLPVELLGGGLTPETFRNNVIMLVQSKSPYQMSEISLLYAQYPEHTCPPKIYNRDTIKELSDYKEKIVSAGYNQKNQAMACQRKQKELLFEAKMESVGIPQPQAAKIIEKASTINLIEQYSILLAEYHAAENQAEKQEAQKQLKAFVKVNKDYFFNHKELILDLHKRMYAHFIGDKENNSDVSAKDTSKQTTAEQTSPQTTDIKPATTPVKTETKQKQAEPIAQESKGIYDYLNERMDKVVHTELRILDHKTSTDKRKSKLKTKKSKNQPQKTTTTILNKDDSSLLSAKGVSEGQSNSSSVKDSSEPFSCKSLRLSDVIHTPTDIGSWTDDYISERLAHDRLWAESMRRGMSHIFQARMQARSIDEFSKLLEEHYSENIGSLYSQLRYSQRLDL